MTTALHPVIAESNPLETTTTINTLSEDLIAEILFRLPARNLLELKTVCKSWKTLISNSRFALNHFRRSIADPTMTNPRLVYSTRHFVDCNIGFFPVQPLLKNTSSPSSNPTTVVSFEMKDCLEILGSCNGLLCLLEIICNFVRLWNPCTGVESDWIEIEQRGVEVVNHGFGYDHVHDRYKLLLFVQKRRQEPTSPMVLTFGANNSWSTMPDFPFYPQRCKGEFVSGTLNWIHKVPVTLNSWMIVFFDLARESFGEVFLPFMNGENVCEPVLQVARECLCVCVDHQKSHFDVWIMKEYGVQESWTKLIVISHVELKHYEPPYPLYLVYIYENGVVLTIPPTSYKLVLYDPNDHNRLHYPLFDSSSDGMTKFPMSERAAPRGFHVFHESLVSPSHLGLPSEVAYWD
ncbi:F-box/kelch-repeat protein At3g23880-like [Arachis ipaensis]|nr:F-box/kelch-repeat protein At3g23880-like [Arachis ipaensis]XP_025677403.1 F-box/kelch-repeat protein At3g23880-like [Arachis hypogaea]QHN79102.1 F-box/kelch-repeat protein [Arachis hypogaea]